jgi:S-adenosylmethionine:tRNA ribosyltransferase-isomerase
LPARNENNVNPDKIDITDFDYPLPDHRIAKYPLYQRDSSKLLVSRPESGISQTVFSKISDELEPGSLVVYNNTRVIHARLNFTKDTGAGIEIFLLAPHLPADYQQILCETETCSWTCLVGNLKKWKDGALKMTINVTGVIINLEANKMGVDKKNDLIVQFSWDKHLSFAEILNNCGKIPIPPYLNRESEEIDRTRYQTVYSQAEGSVAAPTAGLHFTSKVFDDFNKKNIEIDSLTLHVGAGTFQPVKAENALEHKMHAEQIMVSKRLLENLLHHDDKIIATGTTTLRTLESLYWLGVKAIQGNKPEHLQQWEWQTLPDSYSLTESFDALNDYLQQNKLIELSALTEIMIIPGYRFKVSNALITNFHQPKSTLLLLISAFIGEKWKEIYDYALANDFRFLSYGDSSLLFRIRH